MPRIVRRRSLVKYVLLFLSFEAPSSGDSGISVEPSGSPAKSYKKWDNVAKEADEIEEGDPLNNLFQKIFKDANDDTKRAMIKSFVSSFAQFASY